MPNRGFPLLFIKVQEGGTLQGKDGQARHQGIGQGDGLAATPMIGDRLERLANLG